MKVALFVTCLGDQFFAAACADAVRLLRHVGADVSFPTGQTCCGQPAYNSGHRREALRMMKHTIDVFSEADYVVLPSGSCAGMVRVLYPDLADSEELSAVTNDLASRTYELSQFLVDVMDVGRLGEGLRGCRVAYHHGCHALREWASQTSPCRCFEGSVRRWSSGPRTGNAVGSGGHSRRSCPKCPRPWPITSSTRSPRSTS